MFWTKYIELCNSVGKAPTKVAAELGITSGTATKWKNGALPQDRTMKKIADYFSITMEYLKGEEVSALYNSADIAERIKAEAKQKGIPVKKMLGDIGLGNNTMANMKTSMPKADSLAKIADYLGCSVDHLLGKDEEKPAAMNASGIEQEALSLFNQIPAESQEEAMNYLRYMVSKNRENEKKEG